MKQTKILTIANRKGGAGKSTCAAHLAIEAVKHGLKTILIDLDPQKTLEHWWKKRTEENPYLTDIESERIEDIIAKVNNHDFDLCIIDTPGDLSANAINGIRVADLVLIPSKPTAPDLQAIGRTIGMVTEAKKPYLFLITQAIVRSKLSLQGLAVLSKFGQVAPVALCNRTSYANAMNSGGSAAEEDKSAAEELNLTWNFIYSELFGNTEEGNENVKEKVRFNS